MTKQPTKNPDLAREVYYGMGYARSLRKLQKLLTESHGDGAPSSRTLYEWCRRHRWVEGAKAYDLAIAAAVSEKLKDKVVADTTVHVAKLRQIAAALLDTALRELPALKLKELKEVGPAVTIANAALDKSEVLTGGVSDRQEGVPSGKWDGVFGGLHGRDKKPD